MFSGLRPNERVHLPGVGTLRRVKMTSSTGKHDDHLAKALTYLRRLKCVNKAATRCNCVKKKTKMLNVSEKKRNTRRCDTRFSADWRPVTTERCSRTFTHFKQVLERTDDEELKEEILLFFFFWWCCVILFRAFFSFFGRTIAFP